MIEANPEIDDDPGLVNTDPYGAGWLLRIRLADDAEPAGLLTAEEYTALTKEAESDLPWCGTGRRVPRTWPGTPRPPRPGPAVRGGRPRGVARQRRGPDPPGRGQADPGGQQVGALPGAAGRGAGGTGSRASWPSPCPRRCGWPRRGLDDIVVAYPSTDRAALSRLAADPTARAAITVMIDRPISSTSSRSRRGRGQPPRSRSAWTSTAPSPAVGGRIRRGAPLPAAHPGARSRRWPGNGGPAGVRLAGLMAYEAQIAGVGDTPAGAARLRPGGPAMQRRSAPSWPRGAPRSWRRSQVAPLEFVNGGGTG